MRLTQYTDYALRVLVYLALQDRRTTIGEISEAYAISRNHLMKVVNELGHLGYVTTVRGKGGGLVLARLPAEIRIGTLVRQLEKDLALVECFAAETCRCRIADGCRLKPIFEEALAAFFAVLDAYTLADVLKNGHCLRELLRLAERQVELPPLAG